MEKKFIEWLKWRICGKELTQLWLIKQRANDVKVWCSEFKSVSKAAEYILTPNKYDYQAKGCYTGIEDFREYIRKLEKSKGE